MLDENNADFENKLLAKIKKDKMSPKPRWRFLLKDSALWLAGAVALIIGAGAISVMIYLFKYNDWEIYDQTKKTFLEFFILTLPYFWFVFLGIFVFVLYYNFKHTKRGYRYSSILLAGASILLSIFLGSIFYVSGLGEHLDNILGRKAPFYDRIINRHIDFWSQPAEGRLSGVVIGRDKNSEYVLVDRGREEWIVNTENSEPYSGAVIVVGQPIRLLGEETGNHIFRADKILPVNAGREFFHDFNGPMPVPLPLLNGPVPPRATHPGAF